MTLNVLTALAGPKLGGWDVRQPAVVGAIESFQPDLLGLQEVLPRQRDDIVDDLEGYGCLFAGRSDGRRRGEGVPILWRRDRLSPTGSGHFWYSRKPDKPGSRFWSSLLPRMATWATFQLQGTQRELLMVNTHLCCFWRCNRLRSVGILRRRIASLAGGRPVVVTGDFNDRAGGAVEVLLTGDASAGSSGVRLVDVYARLCDDALGEDATMHNAAGDPRRGRIDWILSSEDLSPLSVEIDRRKYAGRWPSDHWPVQAALEDTADTARKHDESPSTEGASRDPGSGRAG
jgi:endonuclease/exonuclease/phosphatase family metal-dependent hydrolase